MQSNPPSQQRRKILVLRLSSLGDVILSSTVLSPGVFPEPVDWVVAAEFASVLRGHPGIARLWAFDRATGFRSWLRICGELADQGYDEVIDLHGSLRTRVARLYLYFRRKPGRMKWRRLPKSRWRLYGLYLLKARWPAIWRPQPMVRRFAEFAAAAGGTEAGPDLSHLARRPEAQDAHRAVISEFAALGGPPYFCVMPGSKWAGKCWAASNYLNVCRATPGRVPVVLGGVKDPGSRELIQLLENEGLPFYSGVGKWDLVQVAGVLAGASAYLGNDTGLAHLAEALGVPALIIYGPTTPEMGFGPWRQQSQAVGLSHLGCRPCGKDGSHCYRLTRRFLCMSGLEAAEVAKVFETMGTGKMRSGAP